MLESCFSIRYDNNNNNNSNNNNNNYLPSYCSIISVDAVTLLTLDSMQNKHAQIRHLARLRENPKGAYKGIQTEIKLDETYPAHPLMRSLSPYESAR